MGHAAAEAVVHGRGVQLVPYTVTGEPLEKTKGNVVGVSAVPVNLVGNEEKEDVLLKLKDDNPSLIIVDFTLPSAVNGNALLYTSLGIPFVMGTTGGDRQKLMEDVVQSGVYALIAPNMGKQVVAFQAMMEMMAENFPGAFSGYTLTVTESHQKTKVDTSGTAKAVVDSFQRLGLDFDVSQVEKVRDPGEQVSKMGVPEGALAGHAFHTYHLVSPEGSVNFEFQHNVVGRSIYGEGTVDACRFLAKKIQDGAEQRVYDMVDVLRAGAMR
ncbi:unnamed protein product [Ostreobium quekettii]|uniref:4-hydroxy-tetrahydrodipicolinate reductase n=1 Tax=Ostreobium quekettii TaxID=121088 RepID=A0A8S1JB74_9CHLO|nr:unnamed protein product [Ostreobium quekettii]